MTFRLFYLPPLRPLLKLRISLLILIALLTMMAGFDNPYFTITKKDVELHIPKGFPKPVYNFKDNPLTPEAFVLGRALFYDPILSRDSSVSCAFCHQRIAAFAHIDHKLSHGINGLIGKRNVPALQNLIWNQSFMWDGGINHLELQPLAPMQNPLEMADSLRLVILKLQHSPAYQKMFTAAFRDSTVTTARIMKSLAQFLGLLISADSRYDRYMRQEDTLSAQERSGLQLFRARCAACHEGQLFTDNKFHYTGLPIDTALRDVGRFAITGQDSDLLKFRTPSLRNVEMTYPYMHDGRFKTLQQVLDFYAAGHFEGHYDHKMDKTSGLSPKNKADLLAFLKTLTDKTFLYDRRFADPNYR